MLSIQPQYLALTKLLAGRLFRIPAYQRAYSWTSRQRQDLFNDIEQVHLKGAMEGHFMAAIVCLRRGEQTLGTDEFSVLDVVDGQQRLTTLILLLQAIKLELTQVDEGKLRGELGDLLVKVASGDLLLLQTNHDTSHHFANFLRDGKVSPSDAAETVADREILKAIEESREFVSTWKEKGRTLSELLSLLKNRLFFLLHEISDEKSVYTVFEVLNSRGLDVSWMDRFKSILMGAAFELQNVNQRGLIDDLHTIWCDIYSVIGLRQGMNTEALRFAATLRQAQSTSKLLSEQNAVQELRSHAGNAIDIRNVASWLLSVTKACDEVSKDSRINNVTRISQARFLATAIHLRQDIPIDKRQELLRRWEKVTFRIYGMLRCDARFCVGDYVRLAWRVTKEKLSVDDIHVGIKAIGKDFPITDAVAALRGANCYEGWEDELRYMMFRWEEHLNKAKGNNYLNAHWQKIWLESPALSIEHIWPQSKAPWKQCHRIGNLTLLPPRLNSKLQARDAKQKVDEYIQTGLQVALEVAETIKQQNGWKVKSIEEREEALLKWAKIEWGD